MMNRCSVEEALTKQHEGIVRLEKEIQNQNQYEKKNIGTKHSEKVVVMSKLVAELVENNGSMKRSMLEMENKYNELLNIIKKLTAEGHEECHKELQQLKVMNYNRSQEMECIKKEHEKISKELKENRGLSDQQQKSFTETIQKNVMEIGSLQFAALKQQNEYENVLRQADELKRQKEQLHVKIFHLQKQLDTKQELELEIQQLKETLDKRNKELRDKEASLTDLVEQNQSLFFRELDMKRALELEIQQLKVTLDTLNEEVRDKEESLEDLVELNQSLIFKERESNDELQEARQALVDGIEELPYPGNIRVKRMGELDTRPFLEAMKKRYNEEEAEERASELCSFWEEYLKDPDWHPFKVIMVEGKAKEIIRDDDEKLNGLIKDLGEGPYNDVVKALLEINEHNPTGRCATKVLWKYKVGRRATLIEGVQTLLNKCKGFKRKRGLT
ncbi:hypothetical protein Fmac_014465 [Flemingia macrophylla]|uniref:Factor of DNA methylation 1-5/IDN2 domain-containing protein n=1 Tax=Flemingia macrophylla TaxID=520843 RepID=A0ABD1MBT2_9FABA